ncbi:MAG: transposase [Rhizobiales bacterium]|nr:transposase [Hyphomicrobiales bacterium]
MDRPSFIDPMQNGFVERFNGKLGDECLKERLFEDLHYIRGILADWQQDYNLVRPHSSLNGLSPYIALNTERNKDIANHEKLNKNINLRLCA